MRTVLSGKPATAPPATTLVEALEAVAASDRTWLAFRHGGVRQELSGADVWRLSSAWAAALEDVGVAAGARVAIIEPNHADFVGAFFGCHLLGAVPVPLAWPLFPASGRRADALAALVATADVAAVAAPASFRDATSFGRPVVAGAVARGLTSRARISPTSPAFIQFTSGSTGAPRGAVISHAAAIANAWGISEALELCDSDVAVSWLPFFHDMGLVGVLLASLLRRFRVEVMTPAEFLLHPGSWLDRLSSARATLTVAPNSAYELLVRRARVKPEHDLSRLRATLSGSEPVHRATIDAFERTFAPAGLQRGACIPVYGLAENALGVAFADAGGSASDLNCAGRVVPSVGRPLAGTEVRISAEDGQQGEILVRSASLMSGYFRQPEATTAALRDGWLHTGDLGIIRDGQLYVTGREKDLVIKGGQKFHPYEIERCAALAVDPPPSGVAAFSAPNPETGTDDLVVIVETRPGIGEEAIRRIRGSLMDDLGVRADRVQLVGVGQLPRTTSGKIRRRECAERFGALA